MGCHAAVFTASREKPVAPDERVSEARIRLEGAYEELERKAARYEQLLDVLLRWRWVTRVREQPELFGEMVRLEESVQPVLERVQAYLRGHDAPAVARLVERVTAARGALSVAVMRRLRRRDALPLAEAAKALEQRVVAEIPDNLWPGERVLIRGVATNASLVPVFLLLGVCLGGSMLLLSEDVGMSVSLAVLCFLPAVVANLFPGRCVLTERRLFWTPQSGPAVQVELASLKPGAFRFHRWFPWLRVEALVPIYMQKCPLLLNLAPAAEVLRWLSTQPDRREEPLAGVRILAGALGKDPSKEDSPRFASGVVVLRRHYAAFFPYAKAGFALQAITGELIREDLGLGAALALLARLPELRFDGLVRTTARQFGLLIENPVAAQAGGAGSCVVTAKDGSRLILLGTRRHLETMIPLVDEPEPSPPR
jgi:hypothetical protein